MPEIGTSGSMSEDGKRSVAKWPKLPRLSSTLPNAKSRAAASRLATTALALLWPMAQRVVAASTARSTMCLRIIERFSKETVSPFSTEPK
jgi:hypothetical protein